MRVVLDANIFISALTTRDGNVARIVQRWLDGEFDLVVSQPIIEELTQVTGYERLQRKYTHLRESRQEFIGLISQQAIRIGDLVARAVQKPHLHRYAKMNSSSTQVYSSDAELLSACRAGNTQAWRQLISKYERLVYSIPLSYGLSPDDAADIAQISLTALLDSLDSLRADSNLGGWLATVARRHTWRLVERRKRERSIALDANDEEIQIPSRTNEIARWEMVEWLHTGLNLIDKRCQQLLSALYFEEREPSYLELAERFDMAEGSIGPTRARCLKRLREMMEL